MNYLELQAEVADWSHRTDLTGKMDMFAQLAESLINKDLRTREMEIRLPVTFTDTYYALPADYMEMRSLRLFISGSRAPLQQFTAQQLDKLYSKATGSPRAYTIHGGEIEFRPGIQATDPYTGEIIYYGRVPTLVTNPTNSVLTTYPSIYLAAMMIQVYIYLQDDEQIGVWSEVYNSQIKAANKSAIGGRYVTPSVNIA